MSKEQKPNPVILKNPLSDNHVIHLHANQDFVLNVTEDQGDHHIEFVSALMRKSEEFKKDGVKTYKFAQVRDFTDWSMLSRCHLGDITIISSTGKCLANISLILEAEGKWSNKNVTTVINPMGNRIKVMADHLLQIVLYDSTVDDDEWGWTHVQDDELMDTSLQLVGSRTILPNEELPTIIQAASCNLGDMTNPIRRSGDLKMLEHHLWFKCEAGVPSDATKTFFSIGNLVFDLKGSPGYFKYDCAVLLNLRNKKSKKLTALATTKNLLAATDNDDWNSRMQQNNYRDDYTGYNVNSITNKHNSYSKSWHSKDRQKVNIVEKVVSDIEGSAKVVYLHA